MQKQPPSNTKYVTTEVWTTSADFGVTPTFILPQQPYMSWLETQEAARKTADPIPPPPPTPPDHGATAWAEPGAPIRLKGTI